MILPNQMMTGDSASGPLTESVPQLLLQSFSEVCFGILHAIQFVCLFVVVILLFVVVVFHLG